MKHHTVLFVDDEVNVLKSLRRALADEEFRSIFLEDPRDVFEIIKKEEISVIISDMKMPEINGLELLNNVKITHPHIVRIILSGYTELPLVLAAINKGEIFKLILKPWNLEEELIPVINEALELYEMNVNK